MRFFHSVFVASVALVFLLLTPGCTTGDSGELVSASLIRLDLDKSEPERLVRYYLGGYLGPAGGDPFEAGWALDRDGRLYLNLDSLHLHYGPSVAGLQDANQNNRLEWDEFAAFVGGTYYDARGIPSTLEGFREVFGRAGDDAWFSVEINGVMTAARRRVSVPLDRLREALRTYLANEQQILYPIGTAIVGEHFIDGRLMETTAMIKRGDGYWDFVTYDTSGTLASSTATPPKALDSPTQCVGCHFGSKLFEPEASFPAEARPGPHGPRAIHVDPLLRDAEVTRYFNEHARRSDTVLGLYATLFIARLRADRRSGELAPEDAALLDALRL